MPARLPPRNDRGDEDRAKNGGDQLRSRGISFSKNDRRRFRLSRANSQEIVDPPLRSARNNVATPRDDPPHLERVSRICLCF